MFDRSFKQTLTEPLVRLSSLHGGREESFAHKEHTITATVISRHHQLRDPELEASFGQYPVVGQASDAVRTYGVMFFYCGISFFAVILLYRLVYEKENKLRQGMKMIGLRVRLTFDWVSEPLTSLRECLIGPLGSSFTLCCFR